MVRSTERPVVRGGRHVRTLRRRGPRTVGRRNAGRAALSAALVAIAALAAACGGGSSGSSGGGGGGGKADEGNLTYWYWAESDAPGANKWMQAMIKQYES